MDTRALIEAELQAMGIDPKRCNQQIVGQLSSLREAQLALLKSILTSAPSIAKPYTVKQLSHEIGVSVQWVYDHIANGDIKTCDVGGRILIPSTEVERITKGVSAM